MYPPPCHVDLDPERIFRVIDAYPLATLIGRTEDGVVATQVPLILDRARGAKGVLLGHMDRNNPHSAFLDGHDALAVFYGPDCYISPTVYASDQLPTWNSVAVHARGAVRTLDSPDALRKLLIRQSERFENGPDRFVLEPDNPHMRRLLSGIVGFEIELQGLVGRFKLSQDKDDTDRARARERLIEESEKSARGLLESLV